MLKIKISINTSMGPLNTKKNKNLIVREKRKKKN